MCDPKIEVCPPQLDCGLGDVVCGAKNAFNQTMAEVANSLLSAARDALKAVGQIWLSSAGIDVKAHFDRYHPENAPNVNIHAGDHPANVTGINDVMGWVVWIALGICVLSLIVAGVRMAWSSHGRDSDRQHGERIGVTLLSTILISGAVAIVAAVLRPGDSPGSEAVATIQNATWWYTVAFGALGVIIGAMKMAWDQRAEAGKDLARSLLTLLIVSGTGVSVVSVLQAGSDEFSKWVIAASLGCQPGDAECMADKMMTLVAAGSSPWGIVITLLFAFLALIISLIQLVLLIIRNGILLILVGVLPLAAAATNTATGKQMFNRVTGWIIGFLLYKPAAAIIYAAAFTITKTKSTEQSMMTIVTGMTLMVMSLVALPALMTLITPAVGNVTSGGTGAAGAIAAALPTGAMILAKGGGGKSGGGSSGGGAQAAAGAMAAPTGSGGSVGGTGASPGGGGKPGGTTAAATSSSGVGGGAKGGGSGAVGGAGGTAGGGGASGAGAGWSPGAGGSSGASSGTASGSGGGGADAPDTGATGAGDTDKSGRMATAVVAGQQVAGALQGVVDDATGAGEGPDGSVEQ